MLTLLFLPVASAEEVEKQYQERVAKLMETSEEAHYDFLTDKPRR